MGVDFGAATQYSLELSTKCEKRYELEGRAKGHYPGKAPLGYLNDPYSIKGEKRIISDPERLNKIKAVFQYLLEGHSLTQGLRYANDELLLRTKNNQKLRKSSFHRLVSNRFYTGDFQWDGIWHKGEHEAIVSSSSFENIQDMIHNRKYPTNYYHKNTFAKLIRCGECHSMITAEPPKKKISKKTGEELVYYYLKCTKSNSNHKCSQKCIRREDLEKQIEDELLKMNIPESLLNWGKCLQTSLEKHSVDISERKGEFQRQLTNLDAKEKVILEKLLGEVISDETYTTTMNEIKDEKKNIIKKMNEAEERRKNLFHDIENSFHFSQRAAHVFKTKGLEERRKVLTSFASNFFLKDRKLVFEPLDQFEVIKKHVSKFVLENEKIEPKYTTKNRSGSDLAVSDELLSSFWSG
jgi:site-specific DNA recombinase